MRATFKQPAHTTWYGREANTSNYYYHGLDAEAMI